MSATSADGEVEYGAHLPLTGPAASRPMPALKAYARAAAALGFRYLCANDHLLFSRPWLDGPTGLAAVVDESDGMRLATTASLPVLRGPVPLAKTLAAIDVLSEGRLVVEVAPGSSAADYAAAGLPFAERWRRFDEAARVLRTLLHGDAKGFSDTLRLLGRLPESFPNALATTWLHVTEDRASAERMLTDVLAPMLNRPAEALRSLPLPIGPAEVCAERLSAFVGAGARRIFVWPLGGAVAQLERFRERVVPLVQR
jgi:alkanesulfonate monooxygenase SsuD/methylene tetrahydromethanopterin reductase-like flavin-dependent oxidoreductase (luciferase family)